MPQPPRITVLTTRFFPAARPSGRLVVVLHGLGDSLEGFLWLPEAMALPGVNYLLVTAPQRYVIGFSWYDLEQPAPGVRRSRELLRELLAELSAQGWAPHETVLFGFSQGCLMSIDLALRYEQRLAGIVGVSGYALLDDGSEGEIHPQAKEQAWLVTHGHQDTQLPLERTRAQMERLAAAGIPIEWHEFQKAHTIDLDDEVPLLRAWIAEKLGEEPE